MNSISATSISVRQACASPNSVIQGCASLNSVSYVSVPSNSMRQVCVTANSVPHMIIAPNFVSKQTDNTSTMADFQTFCCARIFYSQDSLTLIIVWECLIIRSCGHFYRNWIVDDWSKIRNSSFVWFSILCSTYSTRISGCWSSLYW